MDYVADYANQYSANRRREAPEEFRMDLSIHWQFYYAMQCLVYVCCWRYKRFNVGKWNLRELLTNDLGASDMIDRNTCDVFRNLGIVELGKENVVIEKIYVWFPFDPCQIEEIGSVVRPFYNEWGKDDVDLMLDQEWDRLCAKRCRG
jgi:RNA polymerase I-specific transcription initiation factor RRN3